MKLPMSEEKHLTLKRRLRMKTPSRCMLAILFGLMVFCGTTSIVQAEEDKEHSSWNLSGGGGVFSPFDGKTGFTGVIRSMWATSPKTRIGFELDYTKFKTKAFKVKNIQTKSYGVKFLWQHFFRPGKVSPYLGMGFGLSLNKLDDKKIERARPNIEVVSKYAVGLGADGIAGVEFPLGAHFALFTEGKVRVAYFLTSEEERGSGSGADYKAESLGGLSALGGIRLRF